MSPAFSRRALLAGLGGALLLGSRAARADRPVILVLVSEASPRVEEILDAFKSGTEGTVRVTYELGPDVDAAAFLADGTRDMTIATVFSIGDRATAAAAREFAAVPLIYADNTDPAVVSGRESAIGLSLRPDPGRSLEHLRAVLPRLGTLGLIRPARDDDAAWWSALEAAAASQKVTLEVRSVASASDVANALSALTARADAIWPQPDGQLWTGTLISRLLTDAASAHVPIIGLARTWLSATPPAQLVIESDAAGIGARAAKEARTLLGLPSVGAEVPWPDPWLVGSKAAWRATGMQLRKEVADQVDLWVDEH